MSDVRRRAVEAVAEALLASYASEYQADHLGVGDFRPEAARYVDLVWPLARGPQSECPLSARERETLALIADGLSYAEVAARQHVSVATVKTRLSVVSEKTGRSGGTAMVALALREGWIE